jgi:hypothetical protein
VHFEEVKVVGREGGDERKVRRDKGRENMERDEKGKSVVEKGNGAIDD